MKLYHPRALFITAILFVGVLASGFLITLARTPSSATAPRLEQRKASDRAVAYLRDEIATILDGGPSRNNHLLALLTLEEMRGFAIDPASFKIKDFVSGTGQFDEVLMPASIVTASLHIVNRKAREERELCFVFAGLDDEQYGYWRHLDIFECDMNYFDIEDWKEQAAFQPAAKE